MTTPPLPAWDEHAATIVGTLLDLEHGAFQIHARQPLAIAETVVTVPFDQLLILAGQVLSMLHPQFPGAAVVRAHLSGAKINVTRKRPD